LPFIGKDGWQDWNLVRFAIANDTIVVTLTRRDFLKQHAGFEIHPGSAILITQQPENLGRHQIALFEKTLEAVAVMGDDLVNKLMEVLADGSVHVREWNAAESDIDHIENPRGAIGASRSRDGPLSGPQVGWVEPFAKPIIFGSHK
jgi:hypothetical protein